MKFLTTVKPGPMPPPVEVARAGQEWLQAALDDGWIECCYAYPHGGGCSISDVDSHEELMDRLLDYPMSPFVDYEVTPSWSSTRPSTSSSRSSSGLPPEQRRAPRHSGIRAPWPGVTARVTVSERVGRRSSRRGG